MFSQVCVMLSTMGVVWYIVGRVSARGVSRQTPPLHEMATAAVGTHYTGIHSCWMNRTGPGFLIRRVSEGAPTLLHFAPKLFYVDPPLMMNGFNKLTVKDKRTDLPNEQTSNVQHDVSATQRRVEGAFQGTSFFSI